MKPGREARRVEIVGLCLRPRRVLFPSPGPKMPFRSLDTLRRKSRVQPVSRSTQVELDLKAVRHFHENVRSLRRLLELLRAERRQLFHFALGSDEAMNRAFQVLETPAGQETASNAERRTRRLRG